MEPNEIIEKIKLYNKYTIHIRIAAELHRKKMTQEEVHTMLYKSIDFETMGSVDINKLFNVFQDILNLPVKYKLKDIPKP